MAWGDTAKEALSKAIEAIENIAKTDARVQMLMQQWSAFEAKVEARVDRKQSDVEQRLRDLESRMSKTEGKVEGALAQAAGVLLDEELAKRKASRRELRSDGEGAARLPAGDDST